MPKEKLNKDTLEESKTPKDWANAAISDLCTLFNGRAFKQTEWEKNGLPIIRIQNLNKKGAPFNYFKGELDAKHRVKKGDLLFAWSGTPGTSFGTHEWTGEAAALNQHIFKIEISEEKLEKSYFRYAIDQKLDELISSANGGVGLRHITKGTFEKTIVVLPPLAEQKAIAQKLDTLLAQVETTKARLDRIPNILKRFRQSVLAAAVSGKLISNVNGSSSENWSQTNLGVLATFVTSGSRGWAKYYADSGSIFIRSQDINTDDLYLKEPCYLSIPKDSEGKRTKVCRDDILVTITGANVTKCARIKIDLDDAYVSQHVALIRLKDTKNSEFVELALKSLEAGRKQLTEMAYGGGKPGLNLQNIKDVAFSIPCIDEQTQIVQQVKTLFAHADTIEKQVQAAQTRVNSLTQSILAKAFRGELTAEWRAANPDLISGENSAEALLNKIKREAAKPKAKAKKKK